MLPTAVGVLLKLFPKANPILIASEEDITADVKAAYTKGLGQFKMDELKQSKGISLTDEEIEWAKEQGVEDLESILDLVQKHKTLTTGVEG